MSADDRPIRRLGHYAAEATAGVTLNLDALKAGMASPINPNDLMRSPPAEHIRARIAAVEARIADYQAHGQKPPKQTLAELEGMKRRLGLAEHRERLDAARRAVDPDCWCLGYGGRWPGKGIAIQQGDRIFGDPDLSLEESETFYEICSCDLGRAEVARVAAVQDRILQADARRQVAARWGRANIPEKAMRYTWAYYRAEDRAIVDGIRRWGRGEFSRGAMLAGPNQVGKTAIGYLLARDEVERGSAVITHFLPDLFGILTDTFRHDQREQDSTHQQLLDGLSRVPFLFLDDLGAERSSDYNEQTLTQILNARWESDAGVRTVITTNLDADELASRFGERIWARFGAMFDWLVIDWPKVGPAADGMHALTKLFREGAA